jgi:hypothetical protein
MSRPAARFLVPLAVLASGAVFLSVHRAQAQATNPAPASPQKMGGMSMSGGSKMTDAQKIASAMSAAPTSIAKGATIMDFPATSDGKPSQLRAGTNGWVCFPNSPSEFKGASVADPMCLDKQWQAWADGWMGKKTPVVSGTGIAYMLKGDKGASNTDPFATGPTPSNDWVVSPPHIMVLYQDLKMLDAFSTDPKSGGPWVMWKGTPYAHLMVPVSVAAGASMPKAK